MARPSVILEKFLEGFAEESRVGSEIDTKPSRVAKEVSCGMVGIAVKQGVPVASRAIDSFKALFATRLDFELPED